MSIVSNCLVIPFFNVSYLYNIEKFNYVLQEPHLENWLKFHLENAILRWVSKEGNKIAHKLYSK